MRKYKFRAWDIEKKEMIYPQFVSLDQEIDEFTVDGKHWGSKLKLMQYISHMGKDEVFEGDIIKDGNGNIGYVDYLEETFEYVVDYWKKGQTKSTGETLNALGVVEVIGNIYENPKLLEKIK